MQFRTIRTYTRPRMRTGVRDTTTNHGFIRTTLPLMPRTPFIYREIIVHFG